MAAIERTYTIPLRKEWLKAQKYKRAKKAIAGLRKFLQRHMKSENVLLGTHLNLEIWKHGIRNPPSRVKVNVTKDDKGVVKAELFGIKIDEPKKEEAKKEEKKEETKKEDVKIEQKSVPEARPAEVPK
ncbi:50S ribosomal protein L31e [Candidatus Woesearchaeota archaeon]|nr:50S ribosomal protein L31e [Candidatus Woesearchaeota archaeon]